ncbi:conserved hypothetical protein [Prochlorococcus marinus str. MIT 9313]|uniref:Iron-containing redox enzyme family protein n=2 Tax=Prochlorococcus marinus TaxID=1219 RepID=Q7V5J0_PROMM|nr:conserved hypothetical protein [Prochlorococcus marinus str. MIT 9313]
MIRSPIAPPTKDLLKMTTTTIIPTKKFTISEHLASRPQETLQRLALQEKSISSATDARLQKEASDLNDYEENHCTEFTKCILNHMLGLHSEFNDYVSAELFAGRVNTKGYSSYLKQAWYHTSFTPTFEKLFGERLCDYIRSNQGGSFEKGNKFLMLVEKDIDEEEGHELWALRDLSDLGVNHVDPYTDVLPETKALVSSQFDRLSRLEFKGFLGYSFYLEYWVAKYSAMQLQLMEEYGIGGTSKRFIHNHSVVDQGHAKDNLELLNYLITSEDDCKQVIEHMDVAHALYFGMAKQAFSIR